MPFPDSKTMRDQGLLDAAITPGRRQLFHMRRLNRSLSRGEVHRGAIIRIDQAQVPIFGPLIMIGNARDGELDQRLREPVGCPGSRDALGECGKLFQLATAGQMSEALPLYRWFMPLLHLDARGDLVQCIKLCEEIMGRGSSRTRPPRLALEGAARAEVEQIMRTALAHRPNV